MIQKGGTLTFLDPPPPLPLSDPSMSDILIETLAFYLHDGGGFFNTVFPRVYIIGNYFFEFFYDKLPRHKALEMPHKVQARTKGGGGGGGGELIFF